jgi:hypothetical protein
MAILRYFEEKEAKIGQNRSKIGGKVLPNRLGRIKMGDTIPKIC